MRLMRALVLGVLACMAAPAAMAFNVGDRVSCDWKGGGRYYNGFVAGKEGARLFIHYDDGDKEHTTAAMCRGDGSSAGGMGVGSRVSCRWKNGSTWYPGVIAQKTGNQVFIHYNDGDKEHTTLGRCRPR